MHRDSRENCSLLKEEVEGLRKKLERMEKMKEDLLNLENEKAVRVTNNPNDATDSVPVHTHTHPFTPYIQRMAEKLQAWENLGQSTGLNIRSDDELKLLPVSEMTYIQHQHR